MLAGTVWLNDYDAVDPRKAVDVDLHERDLAVRTGRRLGSAVPGNKADPGDPCGADHHDHHALAWRHCSPPVDPLTSYTRDGRLGAEPGTRPSAPSGRGSDRTRSRLTSSKQTVA